MGVVTFPRLPTRRKSTAPGPTAYGRAAAAGAILLVMFAAFVLSRPIYQSQKHARAASRLEAPEAEALRMAQSQAAAQRNVRTRIARSGRLKAERRKAQRASKVLPGSASLDPAIDSGLDAVEDVVEGAAEAASLEASPAAAGQTSAEGPEPHANPHGGWGINAGALLSWSADGNMRALGRGGEVYQPGFVEGALRGHERVVWADGGGHSLAVAEDGTAFAWGRNDSAGGGGGGSPAIQDAGQLGWGAGKGDMLRPAAVEGTGPGGVIMGAVAGGRYHSVGVAADGKVYTWGLNDFGQLGRPGAGECSTGQSCRSGMIAPVPQVPLSGGVAAGRYHSMAVGLDGSVWAWGLNACGEPDALSPANQPARPRRPSRVIGGGLEDTKVVAVSCGYVHWIALSENGDVFTCDTGYDGYANLLAETRSRPEGREPNKELELGRAAPGDKAAMRRAFLTPGLVTGIGPAIAIAAGRCFGLAINAQGHVYSWGCKCVGRPGAERGEKPERVLGALEKANIVSVAAGEYLAVAAASDGRAFVWCTTGIEPHQSGFAMEPKELKGAPPGWNIVALAAGNQHILALASRGRNRAAMTAELPTVVPISARKPVALPSIPVARVRGPMAAVPPAVRAASPDVFAALPKEWDARYKNPCWEQEGKLVCLPYFSIIGVSKCGTTDLFKKLALHPDIKESLNKGPHFWDENHEFPWYTNLYSNVATEVAKSPKVVTGDASSGTLTWSGVGIRGDPQSKFEHGAQRVRLPAVIRAAQPDMKIIAMLRNPVDRLYSAFWYYGCLYKLYERFGMTVDGFDTWARSEVSLYKACEDAGHKDCPARLMHNAQQLVKGIYAPFVEDWLEEYPREELLIIRMEDYSKDTKGHIIKVLDFLDVPQPTEAVWTTMLGSRFNVRGQTTRGAGGACSGDTGPMHPHTRKYLEAFYEPFNRRLAMGLKDSRYKWEWGGP